MGPPPPEADNKAEEPELHITVHPHRRRVSDDESPKPSPRRNTPPGVGPPSPEAEEAEHHIAVHRHHSISDEKSPGPSPKWQPLPGMGHPSPEEDKKGDKAELHITVHQHRRRVSDDKSPKPSPKRPPPSLFKKHKSQAVPMFVAANVVLFVVAMWINNCPRNSDNCVGEVFLGRFAFQSLKENPLLGPSGATLQRLGALEMKKLVEKHQIWRLFTCQWLHAGVVHIFANMLSLVLVGIRLEEEFGPVKIGLLYVISGVGGSLLSSLFIRSTISVGASGALFGLLGGMLSELLTNWTIYENKLLALSILMLIITMNLAMGILPHVDNFAHGGGFFTGFLLGFIILIRPQYAWVKQKHFPSSYKANMTPSQPKYKPYQFVYLGISLAILITGFVVGLVLLLRGVDGNEHCSWCHYLSCMPTPLWKCKSMQAYCESNITDDKLNLKCLSNGKNAAYMWTGGNSTSVLEQLCSQLCN